MNAAADFLTNIFLFSVVYNNYSRKKIFADAKWFLQPRHVELFWWRHTANLTKL